MEWSDNVEFEDMQGLLRFGHGRLTDSCFLLLDIIDAEAAGRWLQAAPVTSAGSHDPLPDTAMQIAFSAEGLRALGLSESLLGDFSEEFISGMAGDESRLRRLGDVGANAPEHWLWGGGGGGAPQVLLLLYARPGAIEDWYQTVRRQPFAAAFGIVARLPTADLGHLEPFGFRDGISQPRIDWASRQSTDPHARDSYSNWLASGEVVLGYANEYGEYTNRPLLDPKLDQRAQLLPNAEEQPALKDLGRNGSYLVIRQLAQDVPGFWQFVDRAAGRRPEQREQLAAAIVGRQRDGTPLAPQTLKQIPGIPRDSDHNHFTYDADPDGIGCPLGAHIRRSNPRTGDFPPDVGGPLSRLVRTLGFGQKRPDEDLVAATRFHRLLRRGRAYGPMLNPDQAIGPDAVQAERGLQFICLVANISRQFEFVQNAWSMNAKFAGVQQERDPLLGQRQPLASGETTNCFNRPEPTGPARTICQLPRFVTTRGGGYFFLPGLRALNYLAALAAEDSVDQR